MRTAPSSRSLCNSTVSVSLASRCSRTRLTLSDTADINSAFIQVSVVLFPQDVPGSDAAALRALLPVYLDSFFTLPIERPDGSVLEFEDVVKQLDAETLSYSINVNSPLQEGITLKVKVAKEKYDVAIRWIRDLLYHSRYTPERLKIAATKALQGLPSEKRDGSEVSYNAYRKMISQDARYVAFPLDTTASSDAMLHRKYEHRPQPFQPDRLLPSVPRGLEGKAGRCCSPIRGPSPCPWVSFRRFVENVLML